MATDATGTPTSPDNIPTYNPDGDAPSGLGFNNAMAAIQTALSARVKATDTTTRKMTLSPSFFAGPTVPQTLWSDGNTSTWIAAFVIPDDYASGDITWKLGRRGSATGTAVMTHSLYRFRNGVARTTLVGGGASNFVAADTNTHFDTIFTLGAAFFQAGDVIELQLVRDGANVSDTLAGNVAFDGSWIEYTGKAL